MAMENKRITQLSTERLTLTSGDYVMVDDADNGSAKYRLDRLKETDNTLSVSGKAADAAATGQAISDEAEARDNADNALGEDIGDLKSAMATADTNYLSPSNLKNINIYYSADHYVFQNATDRLSYGHGTVALNKGDKIVSNVQIRLLSATDPNHFTVFDANENSAISPYDDIYYVLLRIADGTAISPSDVSYVRVQKPNINGFVYGDYTTLNTLTPAYRTTKGYITVLTPIPVKVGQTIDFKDNRAIVSIVHSDDTYTYYGATTGKLPISKSGNMYVILPDTAVYFNISEDVSLYRGTVSNGRLSWNTARITGDRKPFTFLNSNNRSFGILASNVDGTLEDSGWLSTLFNYNAKDGYYTERFNNNAEIEDSLTKTVGSMPVFENVIAHRGYWKIAPENTLASLLSAKAFGFGGVEFDVRFTSDGIPVILHDPTINRTARTKSWSSVGDTLIYVEDVTYSDLVSNYYFDGNFYAKQTIPTLEQYICLAKALNMKCYLEIAYQSKTDYTTAQIQQIVDIVRKYGYEKHVVFISFKLDYLTAVADYYADAEIAYITTTMSDAYIRDTLSAKANYPKLGLAYGGNDKTLAEKAYANGIRLYSTQGNNKSDLTSFLGEVLLTDDYIMTFNV